MFVIFDEDNVLVKRLKVEANIILASTKDNDPQLDYTFDKFSKLIHIAANIDYHYHNHKEIANDFNTLLNIIIGKPLTSLTFDKDEFYVDDVDNGEGKSVLFNKRYEHIRKDIDINTGISNIINLNAYTPIAKKFYIDITKLEVNIPLGWSGLRNIPIFITKGGNMTGEYIMYCSIDPDYILKNNIDITIPIELPLSIIRTKEADLYTIDFRDPNLKLLMTNYTVPILMNKDIIKYDIRKYVKLKR